MHSEISLSLPAVLAHREEFFLEGVDLRDFAIKRIPHQNKLGSLLKVALAAADMSPPRYIKSIFGTAWRWLPPHEAYSEFSAIDFWHPLRTLELMWKLTMPAYDHFPDKWVRTLLPPMIQEAFWRPSRCYRQPDPSDHVASHPSERWFLINGICSHRPIAAMNADLVNRIFRRPSTLVHNQTSSFLWDLVQCALGKTFRVDPDLNDDQTLSTPCLVAATAILDSLQDEHVERVIVIAHSQGTIVAANVVRAIHEAVRTLSFLGRPPTPEEAGAMDELAGKAARSLCGSDQGACDEEAMKKRLIATLEKLEIYLFAHCADRMTYPIVAKNHNNEDVGLPYMETFANENDLVARLGILSPLREKPGDVSGDVSGEEPGEEPVIELDGPAFVQKGEGSWGHLLNEHHLFPIERYLKAPDKMDNPYRPLREDQPAYPRLYGYFYGQRPAPYFSAAGGAV